jgi:hypothetical protein
MPFIIAHWLMESRWGRGELQVKKGERGKGKGERGKEKRARYARIGA